MSSPSPRPVPSILPYWAASANGATVRATRMPVACPARPHPFRGPGQLRAAAAERLLDAVRDIAGAGPLTIVASALVVPDIVDEHGSAGNAGLRPDRAPAKTRIFAAIDLVTTGTRHDGPPPPAELTSCGTLGRPDRRHGAHRLPTRPGTTASWAAPDRRHGAHRLPTRPGTTATNTEVRRRVTASLS
ncbi:hypothetical protein [Actinoplanes teichomyceticus]|uniref:hypothetical protein n=1 Tax=Actinoplanes teichomyceticus TaxID=1867 RepID=UPI001EF22528|nr:hypothetical protein [Actinoplanes teichomyceticus]